MAVDSLDPCGVYFGTTGGQVYASADAGDTWAPIVRDLPAVLSVEVADAAMIRVVLPAHLRTLAHVDGEVELEVEGAGHPALGPRRARGALSRCCAARSATTSRSSAAPFLRFFACEQDLSHEPPDAPLPDAVAAGEEPFLIVGAMAGG